MHAVVIDEFGPPEVLRYREVPDPRPGPGEVAVAVRAGALGSAGLEAARQPGAGVLAGAGSDFKGAGPGRLSNDGGDGPMKVIAKRALCQGHAQCEEAAPEVFEVDDDALVRLRTENPPGELRAKVENAVRWCPVEAIRVED
jgi:ferredoxin